MSDKLRRFEIFSAYDYDGIARRLTKMAQRGWMLEKIGPFCWVYRRVEPKNLAFHVSFYPLGSRFEPEPTPAFDEFSALCGHTGWKPVLNGERFQILCNEDPDPAPVETEPELELLTIHSAAMRTVLPMGAMLMLCALYMIAGALSQLRGGPAMFPLSRMSVVFCMVLLSTVVLYYALELTSYFIWYLRAKRFAVAGKRAPSARISPVLLALQWATFCCILVWGACALILRTGPERLVGPAIILAALLLFNGADTLTEKLRRTHTSPKLNRALILIFSASTFATLSALLTRLM